MVWAEGGLRRAREEGMNVSPEEVTRARSLGGNVVEEEEDDEKTEEEEEEEEPFVALRAACTEKRNPRYELVEGGIKMELVGFSFFFDTSQYETFNHSPPPPFVFPIALIRPISLSTLAFSFSLFSLSDFFLFSLSPFK